VCLLSVYLLFADITLDETTVLSYFTESDDVAIEIIFKSRYSMLGFHISIDCCMEKNLRCSCRVMYFLNVFVIMETVHTCELMLQHHHCYFSVYYINWHIIYSFTVYCDTQHGLYVYRSGVQAHQLEIMGYALYCENSSSLLEVSFLILLPIGTLCSTLTELD